jgi:hydrogenase nickel incorporation protein HypB
MVEIRIEERVLAASEKLARENAKIFQEKKIYVINLMASPGAGKTSFILRTLEALKNKFKIAVIEGDIASKVDAEKIKEHGVEAVQINTGGACHLEGNMMRKAMDVLDLDSLDLIIIENVGNLVCPAEFYLGEDLKVMILSIAEGHDKPHKYPLMFKEADVLIVNKMDLLPLTDFNMEEFEKVVHNLNLEMKMIKVSCKNDEGLEDWYDFLDERIKERGGE